MYCKLIKHSLISELKEIQPHVFELLRKCRSPVEPHGLLCHGDYHMWNVSFSESSSDDLIMFDFQILCYASGMTDVHYYLCQSTTPAMRKQHLDEYLRTYSEKFLQVGNSLGVPEDRLTYFNLDHIKAEYKSRSVFNYIFGLHYFTIRLIEDREKFGTTKTMNDPIEIIRTIDQCGSRTWQIFQHVFDLINEVQELGTIDVMKSMIGADGQPQSAGHGET